MMKRTSASLGVGLGLLVIGVVAASAYLFRTETEDNEALGVLSYRYRWGRPFEIRLDSNRDRATDMRALVEEGETSFSSHGKIREFWEDRDFDGSFELHALVDNSSYRAVIRRLDVDDDADGVYDRTIVGAEAAVAYSSIVGGGT